MTDNIMNIPGGVICSCGENFSCEKYLGKYKKFVKTLKNLSEKEAGEKRKEFFVKELGLTTYCCWLKLQCFHDEMDVVTL